MLGLVLPSVAETRGLRKLLKSQGIGKITKLQEGKNQVNKVKSLIENSSQSS